MEALVKLLNYKKMTISSAESFTGGLFASIISAVPNASKCYFGSVVSYDTSVKEKILGVSRVTIEKYGVVSHEVAEEMVIGVQSKIGTDIAVSFTGNAGPTGMEGKPVGLVFIGIAVLDKVNVLQRNLVGTRTEIRQQAVDIAEEYILKSIGD